MPSPPILSQSWWSPRLVPSHQQPTSYPWHLDLLHQVVHNEKGRPEGEHGHDCGTVRDELIRDLSNQVQVIQMRTVVRLHHGWQFH